jgi:hypothetical protein
MEQLKCPLGRVLVVPTAGSGRMTRIETVGFRDLNILGIQVTTTGLINLDGFVEVMGRLMSQNQANDWMMV